MSTIVAPGINFAVGTRGKGDVFVSISPLVLMSDRRRQLYLLFDDQANNGGILGSRAIFSTRPTGTLTKTWSGRPPMGDLAFTS